MIFVKRNYAIYNFRPNHTKSHQENIESLNYADFHELEKLRWVFISRIFVVCNVFENPSKEMFKYNIMYAFIQYASYRIEPTLLDFQK